MLDKALEDELSALAIANGAKLYDASFVKEDGNLILRISFYKEGGVSLDFCTFMSNLISPLLDVKLADMENYYLEVSSPGIERILSTPNHFGLSKGERLSVKLLDKSIVEGILLSSDDKGFVIETKEGEKSFSYALCKKVKTAFDW
ncbi:ribosome maturation factor RimP [Helicobacter sp. 11S02629-2]|uniref:ribosome maturation factor RimP n=1 Tax=Helicobacter sp. 11S02629-2 TaxID=1476195 RepID=UPI000BA5C478|nr:ribosome maturation factor RimP [Helicobacter sp. 11S02629-2]PAF45324.1 hypothetical protein BKH40_03800 [Helicobacter sp. 11S02629-2]